MSGSEEMDLSRLSIGDENNVYPADDATPSWENITVRRMSHSTTTHKDDWFQTQ